MKHKLLIVDDDEAIRTQMKWALSQDYEVHFAEDRKGALEVFEANSPAVTLLDLGLPPRPNECDEGLAALSEILAVDGTAKVIIISARALTISCASRWRWRNCDCSFGDASTWWNSRKNTASYNRAGAPMYLKICSAPVRKCRQFLLSFVR
jgi:CheY-like chemotaxis protein